MTTHPTQVTQLVWGMLTQEWFLKDCHLAKKNKAMVSLFATYTQMLPSKPAKNVYYMYMLIDWHNAGMNGNIKISIVYTHWATGRSLWN